jgi:toxin ParE1/3/4
VKRSVILAPTAIQDIEDIHAFIQDREGPLRAAAILVGLDKLISHLDQSSQRGHVPPELDAMGTSDIFEVHFKPYRIVYQLKKTSVDVFIVADGRRNFHQLLARRLLR